MVFQGKLIFISHFPLFGTIKIIFHEKLKTSTEWFKFEKINWMVAVVINVDQMKES